MHNRLSSLLDVGVLVLSQNSWNIASNTPPSSRLACLFRLQVISFCETPQSSKGGLKRHIGHILNTMETAVS